MSKRGNELRGDAHGAIQDGDFEWGARQLEAATFHDWFDDNEEAGEIFTQCAAMSVAEYMWNQGRKYERIHSPNSYYSR